MQHIFFLFFLNDALHDIWTLFLFEWKHLIKTLKTQIFELASIEKYIMAYFWKYIVGFTLKGKIFERYLFSARSPIFWRLPIKEQQPYISNLLEFTQLWPVTHLATHHKFGDVVELRPLNRDSPNFLFYY